VPQTKAFLGSICSHILNIYTYTHTHTYTTAGGRSRRWTQRPEGGLDGQSLWASSAAAREEGEEEEERMWKGGEKRRRKS